MNRIQRLKGEGNKSISCDDCKKKYSRIRHFRMFKGKYLCHHCFLKNSTIIKGVGKLKYSMKEALGKTYEIRGWEDKKGNAKSVISIPTILIGYKVKLVLVK